MWLGAFAHRIIFLLSVSSRLASNALGVGSGAGTTGRIGTSPIWRRFLGSWVAVRIKLYFTAAACQDQCTVLLPPHHVVQSETFFIYDNPTMSEVSVVAHGLPGELAERSRGVSASSSIFGVSSRGHFSQFKSFLLCSTFVALSPHPPTTRQLRSSESRHWLPRFIQLWNPRSRSTSAIAQKKPFKRALVHPREADTITRRKRSLIEQSLSESASRWWHFSSSKTPVGNCV